MGSQTVEDYLTQMIRDDIERVAGQDDDDEDVPVPAPPWFYDVIPFRDLSRGPPRPWDAGLYAQHVDGSWSMIVVVEPAQEWIEQALATRQSA